ncbi:MAG: hypothetical protein IT464_00285 [Planctomycetes bacterium]|nr:hypothetical protein [Planctomycetota bacterium]
MRVLLLSLIWLVLTGMLATSSSSPCLAAEESPGTWLDQVHLKFAYARWPKDKTEVCGFEFKPGDYPSLAAFRVVSDSHSVEMTTVPGNPIRALWHGQDAPYRAKVTRTIQLASDAEGRLEISIIVASNVAEAHNHVLEPWLGSQSLPDVVPGADHGVVLGDVSILRDAPASRNGWDGTNSSSFFFFHHNVMIDIAGASQPALRLVALAQEMDKKLEEQRRAANGTPKRPRLTFEVDPAKVRVRDFRPDFGHVSTSYKAEWEGSPDNVKTRAFSTVETANVRAIDDPDSASQTEPDPDNPRTYVAGSLRFDNTDNPGRIEQITNGKHGKYHVGIIGWGPNLLPAFAYVSLEVDGNDS